MKVNSSSENHRLYLHYIQLIVSSIQLNILIEKKAIICHWKSKAYVFNEVICMIQPEK